MNEYTLIGKNVTLSSDLDKRHARELAEIANDSDIARNIGGHGFPSPYTPEDARFFFDQNRKNGKSFFAIDFLIFNSNELVGVIGLKDINREDRNAHVGYWIGKKFWNHGYATEALGLVVKFSGEELNLARLYTKVLDFNLASLRVLMKNGFIVEGFERNAYHLEDGFHAFFTLGRLI